MTETVASSRQKLIEDFNSVIKDTEKLLQALAASGAEKSSTLRDSAEQSIEAARARLKELQDGALERSRAAAKATDEYVHDNPWQSIGVVAMLAAFAGFVIGLLMNRR